MKRENNTSTPDQNNTQLPPATEPGTQNNTTPKDEGEHFEIDILRLIKVKSRRVNGKVIIAILVVLGFTLLLVRGC